MKKVIYLILVFAIILINGCTNSKKAEVENPYVGAWEHISSKFLIHYLNGQKPDTTIVVPNTIPNNIKLLTKKHYSVGHQSENNEVLMGGGEYTYDGDIFTCFPKYHRFTGSAGQPKVWKSKIEGDLWSFSDGIIHKNDTVQWESVENWKRIIE